MLLRQDLTSRSAIATGFVTAGAWLSVAILAVGWEENDTFTIVVVPTVLGVFAWWLNVSWRSLRRARRLGTLRRLTISVEPFSPEWTLFERAWLAVDRVTKATKRTLPDSQAMRLCEQIIGTAQKLYMLAGHVSELTGKCKLIDEGRLANETRRLRAQLATTDGEAATAMERTLSSLSDTSAVLSRLTATRDIVLARLEAGVYALESLHARMIELGTLLESPSSSSDKHTSDIARELEGLRQGLLEVAELSRGVLGRSDP